MLYVYLLLASFGLGADDDEPGFDSPSFAFNVTTDRDVAIESLTMLARKQNNLNLLRLASTIPNTPIKESSNEILPMSMTLSESIKPSPKYGDVMRIECLKKQDKPRLKVIAKCMNNSYGIVMQNAKRKRRKRVEVRLEWIKNRNVKAGIKLKYLKLVPNIYFHFVPYESKENWSFMLQLCNSILSNDRSLLVNQVMDISMINHPNIVSESLISPLIISYDFVHLIDVDEIIGFLSQIPYHLSQRLFYQVMDRLYSSNSAKNKKIRTKLLPKLKSLYFELHQMHYNEFNNPRNQSTELEYPMFALQEESMNATIRFWQSIANVYKAPIEYSRFWETFKRSVMGVLHGELRQRMSMDDSLRALDTFLKGEKNILYTYDLVNTYGASLLSMKRKDIHVICLDETNWNYEKLIDKITEAVLPHPSASLIARSVIKRVSPFGRS